MVIFIMKPFLKVICKSVLKVTFKPILKVILRSCKHTHTEINNTMELTALIEITVTSKPNE